MADEFVPSEILQKMMVFEDKAEPVDQSIQKNKQKLFQIQTNYERKNLTKDDKPDQKKPFDFEDIGTEQKWNIDAPQKKVQPIKRPSTQQPISLAVQVEIPIISQIQQEVDPEINEEEYQKYIKPVHIDEIPQDKMEVEYTFLEALKNNEFVLLQFPPILPFQQLIDQQKLNNQPYVPKEQEIGEQLKEYYSEIYDSSGIKVNKAYDSFIKTDSIQLHHLGKITIDSSGKAQLVAGDESFILQKGIQSSINSHLVAIDQANYRYHPLADVNTKFIVKPNCDELIS